MPIGHRLSGDTLLGRTVYQRDERNQDVIWRTCRQIYTIGGAAQFQPSGLLPLSADSLDLARSTRVFARAMHSRIVFPGTLDAMSLRSMPVKPSYFQRSLRSRVAGNATRASSNAFCCSFVQLSLIIILIDLSAVAYLSRKFPENAYSDS